MTALNKQALRQTAEKAQEHGVFNMDIHSQTVLALPDELEKEKGYASTFEAEKWHYHELAESEGERADRAEKALDAAEDRIAELEARTVTLPDRKSIQFWPGDASEFDHLGYEIAVENAIRAAGIGVKGE